MAVNQLSISERFHLDQVPQSGPQLTVLLRENGDYLLSAAELLDTDHEGERIYRMVAPVQNVQIRGLGIAVAGLTEAGTASAVDPKADVTGASETDGSDAKASGAGASAADETGAAADALTISETGETGGGDDPALAAGTATGTTETSAVDGAGAESSGSGASAAGEAGTGVSETGASAAGEAGTGVSETGASGQREAVSGKSGTAESRSSADAEEADAQTGDTDAGYDDEDLYVVADGHVIGRIRPEDSLHFRNIARNYKITGMEIRLHGGAYRVVREEADGTVLEDQGIARWSAVLTVYRRVPRSGTIVGQESISAQQLSKLLSTLESAQMAGSAGFAAGGNISGSGRDSFTDRQNSARGSGGRAADGAAESGNNRDSRDSRDNRDSRLADRYRAESDSDTGWIDTSYATVTQEKDPTGRGMFFLLLAAVVSIAYLCFSVPAWIPSLAAGRSTLDTPVIQILGLPGYVPGAVLGAGLLLNIIAMFTAGGVLPTIASLLYVAAGFLAPSCLIFTLIPAGLCLLGAFCKKKGIAALRILLGIAVVAAASFLLYQHVSGKDLFNPFKNRDLTDIESVRAFMSGDLPPVTDEYEAASEYYEDESEWVWDVSEDETDLEDEGFLSEEYWEEETDEEGDWWEDESDLEEGILFEMETDEDGNYIDREAGLISSDGITWEVLDDPEAEL